MQKIPGKKLVNKDLGKELALFVYLLGQEIVG
jgi:hypothetical protein